MRRLSRLRSGRAVCALGIFVVVAVGLASGQTAADSKGLAKGMLDQGEQLEKKGDLDEALALYVKSAGTWHSNDTDAHIAAIKTKIANRYLDEAAKLYATGSYRDAIARVGLAESMARESPRVFYNYAACYYKLGDREKALDNLAHAESLLDPKSPERVRLAQLRSVVSTGEAVGDIPSESRETISALDKLLSASLDEKAENITDFRDAELEQDAARCKALGEASSRLPRTAAVFFNLAKCAQQDGRFEEARDYFSSYLKVAPEAMDGKEVQLSLADIEAMARESGPNAEELRKLFAEAYRLIGVRKYGEAIQTYQKAETLDPSFAQTKYKLGLLYDAAGNVELTRKYLQDYLATETNEQAKAPAMAMLETITKRHEVFDQHIQAARRDLLSGQYAPAEKELREAAAFFPLSPEAHTLLAYTFLNGNNPEAARRSMDVVWAFGYPVSFYARVFENFSPAEASGSKQTQFRPSMRAAKVEIEPNVLRLVYLTAAPAAQQGTTTAKKQRKTPSTPVSSTPALTPSALLGDKLANLSGSSRALIPDNSPDVRMIPVSTLKEVRTDGSSVLLRLDAPKEKVHLGKWVNVKLWQDLRLNPSVAFTPPVESWPARKFANTYTRFFSQYLGIDGVKLGAEHMTFGEKALVVLMVAAAAGGAYSSLENVSKVLGAVAAGTNAYAALQASVLRQRAMIQSLDFKLIPSEPMQLDFRTEEFK